MQRRRNRPDLRKMRPGRNPAESVNTAFCRISCSPIRKTAAGENRGCFQIKDVIRWPRWQSYCPITRLAAEAVVVSAAASAAAQKDQDPDKVAAKADPAGIAAVVIVASAAAAKSEAAVAAAAAQKNQDPEDAASSIAP